MKKSRTVRRDWLMRQIAAGNALVKGKCILTDDYAADSASNAGKTDWMPAYIKEHQDDYRDGQMGFSPGDFKYRSGAAYREANGDITFIVMANESYTVRIIPENKRGQKVHSVAEPRA